MTAKQQFDPVDLTQRLQFAIAAGGFTIRSFQETLKDRGAANSAYSSVFRYVKGEVVPPLEWFQEAARVLKQRPEWLAFGVNAGLPHDTPTRSPLWSDPTGLGSMRGQVGHRLTTLTFPVHDAGKDLLAGLVESLALAQPFDGPRASDEEKAELGLRLEFVVHRLLGAIAKSYSGRASSAATLGILSALLGFVPEPGQGNRVADVSRRLPTPPETWQAADDAAGGPRAPDEGGNTDA